MPACGVLPVPPADDLAGAYATCDPGASPHACWERGSARGEAHITHRSLALPPTASGPATPDRCDHHRAPATTTTVDRDHEEATPMTRQTAAIAPYNTGDRK